MTGILPSPIDWHSLEKILRHARAKNESCALELTNWIAENRRNAEPIATGKGGDDKFLRCLIDVVQTDWGCGFPGTPEQDAYIEKAKQVYSGTLELHDNTEQKKTAEPCGDEALTIADYEEVLADKRRLVREIDVIINGEDGAAKQASLCDLVGQIRELVAIRDAKPAAPTQIDAGELENALCHLQMEYCAMWQRPDVDPTKKSLDVVLKAARAHLSKFSGGE